MATKAENAFLFEGFDRISQALHGAEFRAEERRRLQRERDAIADAGEERLSGRTFFEGQTTTTSGGGLVDQGFIGNFFASIGVIPEKLAPEISITSHPFGAAIDESKSFKGLIDIAREGEEGLAQLLQSSQARTEDVQAKFLGLGDQAIEDTRMAFKAKAGQTLIDIGNRGFSGGILQDALSQNFRGQENEVNRIRESVRNAQAGAFERTTGDSLNIESTSINRRAQFQASPGFGADITASQLSALNQGVTAVPPGEGPFSGLSEIALATSSGGDGGGGPSTGQKALQGGAGAISGGAGLGLAAAAAPATAGLSIPLFIGLGAVAGGAGAAAGCLHGDTMLSDRIGLTPISAVAVGDEIMGADNEFHRVIAIDDGDIPESPQREPYVKLIAGFNEIIVTTMHPVDGKPAGQWEPGEHIECFGNEYVVLIESHDYVCGHDIMLAGDVDYVANGFVVASVIGKIISEIGMGKWDEIREQSRVLETA